MNRILLAPGVALMLSACGEGGDAASRRGTLSYSSCTEQTALVLVPAALLPALPEGFAYTTPAGDIGVAAIHISGAICEPADGGEQAREVLAFALAAVPERYRSPDIATYAVALGGYSTRAESVAQFEAWGLHGLIEQAEVTISVTETAGVRVGRVEAIGADSQLTTQINVLGPQTVGEPGGGHTRALYIVEGEVLGAVDAVYSEQTAMFGAGTVMQSGSGPVPAPLSPATGSHAFGYALEISSPTFD